MKNSIRNYVMTGLGVGFLVAIIPSVALSADRYFANVCVNVTNGVQSYLNVPLGLNSGSFVGVAEGFNTMPATASCGTGQRQQVQLSGPVTSLTISNFMAEWENSSASCNGPINFTKGYALRQNNLGNPNTTGGKDYLLQETIRFGLFTQSAGADAYGNAPAKCVMSFGTVNTPL